MNIKRIVFWVGFFVIMGLIVWGLIVAMNRPLGAGPKLGAPPEVTAADHVRFSAFARGSDEDKAKDARVTIIEYSDFQCPACAAYYPLVEKLLAESSTTIRFIYRHFPLYPQPHKNAFVAAQTSEAASAQGKFWEIYRLLFENQTAWSESDKAAALFEGYAERIGLNMAVYRNDLDTTETKSHIQHDRDEAVTLGVGGTPTFFVNGKAIVNPQGYKAFKKVIDDAARAGAN